MRHPHDAAPLRSSAHGWCMTRHLSALQRSNTTALPVPILTDGMSAGVDDTLGRIYDAPALIGGPLHQLAASFAAALQDYHIRATSCGQSFEHMVLLEAAVQGWHVTALLFNVFSSILKARMRLWQEGSGACILQQNLPVLRLTLRDRSQHVDNVEWARYKLQHQMCTVHAS